MRGDLQRAVGASVRRIRTERGLTQEGLAEHAGLHRTYIGGVERGERNLSLQALEDLAARIGVEPLELLAAKPRDDA